MGGAFGFDLRKRSFESPLRFSVELGCFID